MKKSKRVQYLIPIAMLLITGTSMHSCKHDPPDPGPLDLGFFGLGEAKDYVYFKKGTWWVYQNTRTMEYDTIVVYNNFLDTIAQTGEKWKFNEEVFKVSSVSQSTGYKYNCFMRTQGATGSLYKPEPFCLPIIERYNPYEGELEPFYYPFDFKNYKSCLGVKDTLIINNKVYKEVAVFYIKRDNIEPHPLEGKAAKYYWARNYGLIRKDLFDSKFQGDTAILFHSWQIINSHIIQ